MRSRARAEVLLNRNVDPGGDWPCSLFVGVERDALADLQLAIAHRPAGSELDWHDERGRIATCILEGWACREVVLADGRRQILGVMFPGDLGAEWTAPVGPIDHRVRTLTSCRVLTARADALTALARVEPVVGARMDRAAQLEISLLHGALLNVGQRKAPERIAHLICELVHRLKASGADGAEPVIPLTQQDFADALGMTSVHVNRVLQRLRRDGLVQIRKGAVIVKDQPALTDFCGFSASYIAA